MNMDLRAYFPVTQQRPSAVNSPSQSVKESARLQQEGAEEKPSGAAKTGTAKTGTIKTGTASGGATRRRAAPGAPPAKMRRELIEHARGQGKEVEEDMRAIVAASAWSVTEIGELPDKRHAACALAFRRVRDTYDAYELITALCVHRDAHNPTVAQELLDDTRFLNDHAFTSKEVNSVLWRIAEGVGGSSGTKLHTFDPACVQRNPYTLIQDYGMSFASVNSMAVSNGWWSVGSVEQLQGYLDMFFTTGRGHGSTLLFWRDMYVMGAAAECGCKTAEERCTLARSLATLRSKIEDSGLIAGYSPSALLRAEHSLYRLHTYNTATTGDEGTATPVSWCEPRPLSSFLQSRLVEEQLDAVRASHQNNMLIVQGGAGCGKTEVGIAIATQYGKVHWVAPTHTAKRNARRRWEAADTSETDNTTIEFSTVHAFGATMMTKSDAATEQQCMDLVVVDEISMADSQMLARVLVPCGRYRIKVLMLGDVNQLQPIGPGCPMADMYAAAMRVGGGRNRALPLLTLEQNHRSTGRGIPEFARRILCRDDPAFAFQLTEEVAVYDDVTLIEVGTDAETESAMAGVVESLRERGVVPAASREVAESESNDTRAAVPPPETLRVITPNRVVAEKYAAQVRGIYDGTALSASASSSGAFDSAALHVGDTVLFGCNREYYHNGDLGVVQSVENIGGRRAYVVRVVDTDARTSCVKEYPEASARARAVQLIAEGVVQIMASRARYELALSHATTVHKSQGQEADHVLVVLPPSVSSVLRVLRLLYTAATRAKKHLYLIGDPRVMSECIRKEGKTRVTALRALLMAQ